MGCHFLLQGIFPTQGSNPHLLHCQQILYHLATRKTLIKCLCCVCVCAQSGRTLCNPMDCSPPYPRPFCPWNSPGRNTGVSCHSLLQRVFPTQRSNLVLLHCRQIFSHLSHQEVCVSFQFMFKRTPLLSTILIR